MSKPKKIDNSIGPDKVKRDANGLLENIQYIFNEDGFVDWRAMINDEHLYPNKGWFEKFDKEVPDSVKGLKDHQLLIKLSGIKELLKLRGYKSVNFTVIESSYDRAVVKCEVKFTPNYETNYNSIDFTEVANATSNNCDGFSVKFLESIAANRAFVRCVRNFLNVHIVGADEIDKSTPKKEEDQSDVLETKTVSSASFSPQETLSSKFEDLQDFKEALRELWKKELYKNEDAANWESFSDIPAKEARVILGLLH